MQSRSYKCTRLPCAVPEDLHLDVARAPHQLLEIHLVVAERGFRLAPGRRDELVQLRFVLHDAHAAAAAAPARFQHHGIADLCREPGSGPFVRRQRRGRRHYRNARADRQIARLHLVAEPAQGVGRRPDENDSRGRATLGEVRVLGQKPIAGVDGVGVRLARDADDVVHVEIGLDGALALAHEVALVRLHPVQGKAVLLRVDRNGADGRARSPPA